jgi:guanylate kinase
MADPKALPRRGLMFILSSPSGAGKTTIARKLLAAEGGAVAMSVSVTTRPIRPGEVDGRDYHFTYAESFRQMVADDAFLEWAEVFGNLYGTPRAAVLQGLAEGCDYLFDVDWQGAQQLSQSSGADVVSVFLLPPSVGELEHRLRSRGTDSEQVIQGRMERARAEMSHWSEYDYVVVNDDVEACFDKVRTILAAERLKRPRQTGLIAFTRELMR